MEVPYIILVAASVVGICYALVGHLLERNKLAVIRRRPAKPVQEWHEMFFGDKRAPNAMTLRALECLAECLGVSMLQLLPTDSFREDLRGPWPSVFVDSHLDLFEEKLSSILRSECARTPPDFRHLANLGQFAAMLDEMSSAKGSQ